MTVLIGTAWWRQLPASSGWASKGISEHGSLSVGLIRIPGVGHPLDERDIKPCGTCGNSEFWIARVRMGVALRCTRCLPPNNSEQTLGFVDMVKREVKLSGRQK